MASNPPGKCCGEGHIHKGTPKGKITTFAGGKPLFILFHIVPN